MLEASWKAGVTLDCLPCYVKRNLLKGTIFCQPSWILGCLQSLFGNRKRDFAVQSRGCICVQSPLPICWLILMVAVIPCQFDYAFQVMKALRLALETGTLVQKLYSSEDMSMIEQTPPLLLLLLNLCVAASKNYNLCIPQSLMQAKQIYMVSAQQHDWCPLSLWLLWELYSLL